MLRNIEEKIMTLPEESGVYLMKDADGTIIYVGKAISLKRRVKQYFQSKYHEPKVAAMVSHVADFETIVTSGELEALILECNLIKEHSPKYNILLRDDKQYPYFKIDMSEDFPAIKVARRISKDKARYFGPYKAAHSVREMLNMVAEIFPARTCNRNLVEGVPNGRPCLSYQIGRCMGPCTGNVTREEYHQMMEQAADFLSGKYVKLVSDLTKRMAEASEKLEFERAAIYRDRIESIQSVMERQITAASTTRENRDVIGLAPSSASCMIEIMQIRSGLLSSGEHCRMAQSEGADDAEILQNFIMQYYSASPEIPGEILVPTMPNEAEVLEDLLSESAGRRVHISSPKRGRALELVKLAEQNALQISMREEKRKEQMFEKTRADLAELGAVCGLDRPPQRIEGYDISNTQGVYSVASMVVFEDGKPAKHAYRRFRIKTVEGANDFASLAEVVTRRFRRQMEGDDKFLAMPDLIMIDGGPQQLRFAYEALQAIGVNANLCSLAKRDEEIYLVGREVPIRLPRTSGALQTLQRLRDEAHRFAITYHRGLRSKKMLGSVLEETEGIGPKRREALLRRFKSMAAIEAATLDELAATDGMSRSAAENLYGSLHPAKDEKKEVNENLGSANDANEKSLDREMTENDVYE